MFFVMLKVMLGLRVLIEPVSPGTGVMERDECRPVPPLQALEFRLCNVDVELPVGFTSETVLRPDGGRN